MTIPELLDRGLRYANERNFDAAIKDFNELLRRSGASVDQVAIALRNRGVVNQLKGEMEKAIVDYTNVIELRGARAEQVAKAYKSRGYLHSLKGQSEKAIADYTKAIELPGEPVMQVAEAIRNRGVEYGKKGESEKAIADYTRVIELHRVPANQVAEALWNRGYEYLRKGEISMAISDYTGTIKLQGASSDQIAKALRSRGLAFGEIGETDNAISDYTRVIKLAGAPIDEVITALGNRGFEFSKIGELNKAIADQTSVIEMREAPIEEIARALVNRGFVYVTKAEPDNAIADFDKAISLPKAPVEQIAKAYVNRGVVSGQKGELKEAVADFKRAIKLKGAPVEQVAIALWNRAYAYTQQGKIIRAITDYTQATQLPGASKEQVARALLKRGVLWHQINKMGKAMGDFREAVALKSDIDPAFEFLISPLKVPNSDYTKAIQDKCMLIWFLTVNNIRNFATDGIDGINGQTQVTHYSKLSVADALISNKDARMHYTNAEFMKDPLEGRVLLDYCLKDNEQDNKINEAFGRGQASDDFGIYLGSFIAATPLKGQEKQSGNEDKLLLWMTYGKDENGNEAAGCSFVIEAEFFDKGSYYLQPDLQPKIKESELMDFNNASRKKAKQPLFKVLYFDVRKGQFEEKDKAMSDKIGLEVATLKAQLKELIELSSISEELRTVVDRIVYIIISELRYFFKSQDFAFEEELRVIQFVPRGAVSVKIDVNRGNTPFIESSKPILPYLRAIVLGPKVSQPAQWNYLGTLAKQRGFEIELRNSVVMYR